MNVARTKIIAGVALSPQRLVSAAFFSTTLTRAQRLLNDGLYDSLATHNNQFISCADANVTAH